MLFRSPPKYTSAAPQMNFPQPTMYVPPPSQTPIPPPPRRNEPELGISDAIDGYNNYSMIRGMFGGTGGTGLASNIHATPTVGAAGLSDVFAPTAAGSTSLGGASGFGFGQGGILSSSGSLGSMGPIGAIMAAVAISKTLSQNRLEDDPDDFAGNLSLSQLGPSISQMWEDPKGMLLPTAMGGMFLTPLTASDKAKQTAPEWQGLMGK